MILQRYSVVVKKWIFFLYCFLVLYFFYSSVLCRNFSKSLFSVSRFSRSSGKPSNNSVRDFLKSVFQFFVSQNKREEEKRLFFKKVSLQKKKKKYLPNRKEANTSGVNSIFSPFFLKIYLSPL